MEHRRVVCLSGGNIGRGDFPPDREAVGHLGTPFGRTLAPVSFPPQRGGQPSASAEFRTPGVALTDTCDAGTRAEHPPAAGDITSSQGTSRTHVDLLMKPSRSRRPHTTGDRRDREDADYDINAYTSTIHVNITGR